MTRVEQGFFVAAIVFAVLLMVFSAVARVMS